MKVINIIVYALLYLLLFANSLHGRKELQKDEDIHGEKQPSSFDPKTKALNDLPHGKNLKSLSKDFDPKPNIFLFYPGYSKNEAKDEVMNEKKSRYNVLKLPSMHDRLPSYTVFFTMNDLKVGNRWATCLAPLDLSKSTPPLLSKEEAEAIPFSYKQLPYLLELFSLSLDSPQGRAVEEALRLCEAPPIKGETKFCATFYESMLDFVGSMLGSKTNLEAIKTTHLTRSKSIIQNYTITQVPKEILTPKMVSCHTVPYPYEIVYCHAMTKTKVIRVSLAGQNGDKVEALAVCHLDTSEWSAGHRAFHDIGSKPGLTDACHFLPEDHFIWVSKQQA